jgi:glycine oxidase
MMVESSPDVVVVGAGVIGLSCGWQAAAAGLSVVVIDPHPGHGATWAAAGMLAPAGEAHFGEDALTALNLRAARAWPAFAHSLQETSGITVHYLADGTLMVAVDPSDQVAADDLLAYRQALGLSADRLSGRECREAEPLVAPGVRGGANLVDDHQVDNRLVVSALLSACSNHGVTMVADEVTGLEQRRGRVVGVTLRTGARCPAGTVVLAAGCRSGRLDGVPDHVLPPVRPVKGLTLRLAAPDTVPTLRRPLRGLVHGRTCYLVPRPDRTVVVGATVEERGFDLSVTVGAVGDLLDDGRRLVPVLEEYELVDTTTGLRPGTPDNAPIVGQTDIPGLLVATGHYRNGILLAPVTAHEVVRLLVGAAARGTPVGGWDDRGDFAPFRPGRFGDPAPEVRRRPPHPEHAPARR